MKNSSPAGSRSFKGSNTIPSTNASLIERLIQAEAKTHYDSPPPQGQPPYLVVNRSSSVLVSAPHGCRTFRNRNGETWHDEDEYTAGIALLLSELCQVSVIATLWRTDDSDPNDTKETGEAGGRTSPYKKVVRSLCEQGVRWVVDLHGAGQDNPYMAEAQLIDLGLGHPHNPSLPADAAAYLRQLIESVFGKGSASRGGKRGFPAANQGRSITAFVHQILHKNAVQIEMKPSIRVARRRPEAGMYHKARPYGGPFSAPPENILAMLQVLVDFIEYLKEN